jgi:hypothetical protein
MDEKKKKREIQNRMMTNVEKQQKEECYKINYE